MVRGVASKVGALDGMTGEEWLAMRANDCPMKRVGRTLGNRWRRGVFGFAGFPLPDRTGN